MDSRKTLLVSISGGETSAYMASILKENTPHGYKDIKFVFANTGLELPETLDFLNNFGALRSLDVEWVEAITNPQRGKGVRAKRVDYASASRNGDPFLNMVKKHGLPTVKAAFCTRELKDRAIRAYMRQQGYKKSDYDVAIGIRADEIDRAQHSINRANNNLVYPLIQWFPTTKIDINTFFETQKFRLEIPTHLGNCDFCPKKSDRKLAAVYKDRPERLAFWQDIEREFGNWSPRDSQTLPVKIFRGNKDTSFLTNYDYAQFEYPSDDRYKGLGKDILEIDKEGSCGTSCMPFH